MKLENPDRMEALKQTIEERLERDGYIMRSEMLSLFNDERKQWNGLTEEDEFVFIIRDARISSLPKPHIARDFTCQMEIEFRFPSGDVIQTTRMRGFA